MTVTRFGHQSLTIIVHFVPILVSAVDPASTLSFSAPLRNSHESPAFKSLIALPTAKAANTYVFAAC